MSTVSSIYDLYGHRKYLTRAEVVAFLRSAKESPPEVETFCTTLAYTGARLSEALSITPAHIDFGNGVVAIETLKRRRRGVFRQIVVPTDLLSRMDAVHSIKRRAEDARAYEPLWGWGRTTAWLKVKDVMARASIAGPQASPKALRHSMAVTALQAGVPLHLVSRWLGHARLSTTAIYADVIGEEERDLASRFWGRLREAGRHLESESSLNQSDLAAVLRHRS